MQGGKLLLRQTAIQDRLGRTRDNAYVKTSNEHRKHVLCGMQWLVEAIVARGSFQNQEEMG